MLARLILRNQRPAQLLLAVLGTVFGMLLLLASLQVYNDVQTLLNNKSEDAVLGPHYVVINKEVSLLNTLSMASTEFTDEEVKALKEQAFTQNLSGFSASLFGARAFVDQQANPGFPPLYTDLFFEALPNSFLDVKPNDWKWEEGTTSLPIIVPADYMNMYNFGFAPSQGLPQLSKKTVSLATFKVKVWGKGREDVLDAHVAGFSNRINTILVPEKFLNYANEQFGSGKQKRPSRLIISTPDPSAPELQKFLEEKGYETNAEQMRNGKLNSLLRVIMKICLVIGGVIILLSLLGFVQYAQLIINRSAYELLTLIKLGYDYKLLWRKYFLFYTSIFSTVFVLALIALHYVKAYFATFMGEKGFGVEDGLSAAVVQTGFLLTLALLLFNGTAVFISLKNLAKMGRRL